MATTQVVSVSHKLTCQIRPQVSFLQHCGCIYTSYFLPILELTASVIEKVTADGNAPTPEPLIMVDPVIKALCICRY